MKTIFLSLALIATTNLVQAQKLGTIDSLYGTNGSVTIDHANLDADEIITSSVKGNQGDVFLIGYSNGATVDVLVSHVLADGTLDPNYANAGIFISDFTLGASEVATDAYFNADGSLFVTGFFAGANDADAFVLKLTDKGALDANFGDNGIAKHDLGYEDFIKKIAVRPDGKIVIAGDVNNGADNDFILALLNADGTKVTTFGDQGVLLVGFSTNSELLSSLLVDATNNIYLGGTTTAAQAVSVAIAKVGALGNLDGTFALSGRFTYAEGAYNTYLKDMKFDASGRIVGGGYVKGGINDDLMIFRISNKGDFDLNFDTDGKRVFGLKIGNPVSERFNSLDIQSDEKIVLCGSGLENGNKSYLYMRLESTGKSDAGFSGPYGWTLIPEAAFTGAIFNKIHVVSNERAIITGSMTKTSKDALLVAIRLTEPFAAGINKPNINSLSVYPNPANGAFQIENLPENIEVALYALNGQKLVSWEKGTTNYTLPSTIEAGVYFLSAQEGRELFRTKIIVY